MTQPEGYGVGHAYVQLAASFDRIRKEIGEFFRDVGALKVPVELDKKALSDALRRAGQGTVPKVRIEPDAKALNAAMAKAAQGTTAKVAIQPDTALLDAKLRELGDRKVKIVAQIDARTATLQAELAALEKRRIDLHASVNAKIDKAERQIARLVAKRWDTTVDVEPDLQRLNAALAALHAQRGQIDVDVDARIHAAEVKLAELGAKRVHVEASVDLEGAQLAEAQLRSLEGAAKNVDNIRIDVHAEASQVARVLGIVGLLTAGVAALGFAGPAAAAGLATIPLALSGAGQGVATLIAGFYGVGDAVKAMQAVEDQAASSARSNARQRVSQAHQVANAAASLERAQIQADRAAITGAQQVAQARESLRQALDRVADAQESALRRTSDAQRALTRAQESALDAQRALTRAREEARERLEDLHLTLRGTAIAEEEAEIALARASERLAQARREGWEDLELREAYIGAQRAGHELDVVRERYADLRDEAAEAARSGVEGDRLVVEAHERVSAAAQRVTDAQRDLDQARRDGARQVARAQEAATQAQERLGQAQQQAAWAQADAARAVADAQRQMQQAIESATDSGSAAVDKLEKAMAKLTPAGRSFVHFLRGELKSALMTIGGSTQEAMLPGVEQGLRELLELTPIVSDAMADTGKIIGELAKEGAAMATSGPWKADFVAIARANNDIFRTLGGAGLDLADALRNITAASAPLLLDFANATAAGAETFATWIQGKRDTGELSQFLEEMAGRLKRLGEFLVTVGTAFFDLAMALGPLGGVLLTIVEHVAQFVSWLTHLSPELTNLIAGATLLYTAFLVLGRTLGGTVGSFREATRGYRLFGERVANATSSLTGFTRNVANLPSTLGTARIELATTRRFFDQNAAAASTFGIRADGAATRVAQTFSGTLSGAVANTTTTLDRFIPATNRASDALTTMSTTMRTGIQSIADRIPIAVSAWETGVATITRSARGAGRAITTGLRTAVSGLAGALGGPWGLAITGAVIGLGFLADAQSRAAERAQQHRDRVEGLAAALRESNGVLDENVRKKAAADLANIKVGESEATLLAEVRRLLGPGALPTLTDAYLGNAEAQQYLVGELERTIDANVRHEKAIHGSRTIPTLNETGAAAAALREALTGTNGTYADAVQHNKDLAAAAEASATRVDELSAAEKEAERITGFLAGKLKTAADSAQDLATRGRAIIEFLDELKGRSPTIEESVDGVNEAIRRLAEGFTDANGNVVDFGDNILNAHGEIDSTTEAGAQLKTTVQDLAGDLAAAGQAAFDQARQQGKSIPEAYQAAVDAMDPYIARIREALEANGLTETQIDALIGRYNLIPAEIATIIRLTGDQQAQEQVAHVLGQLETLPDNKPVQVDALTGVAQQSLIELGYHIVQLPDGTFAVFGNTAPGRTAADQFIKDYHGRRITLEAAMNMAQAEADLQTFKDRFKHVELNASLTVTGAIGYTDTQGRRRVLGSPRAAFAEGGIAEFYQRGGFRQLQGGVAQVVPPNTLRVIGDRPQGDEAYIPINRDPRSIAILEETAKRMGFSLAPLARGAVLGFQNGGVTTPTTTTAPTTPTEPGTDPAALAAYHEIVGLLNTALTTLTATTILFTTTALLPLATTIGTVVVPALSVLQLHSGVLAVQAISLLRAQLPLAQADFQLTATVVTNAWYQMSTTANTQVAAITGALANLRSGLHQTGLAFDNTAVWVRDAWGRIRAYTADPVRDSIHGPMNAGLVNAWNRIDGFFALNKHLDHIPVTFAVGGEVPGTGRGDIVPALLEPGEYVLSKKVVDTWGLANIHAAHLAARRGTFGGLEGMLHGDEDGIFRVGYASGGPVPEALARGIAFAKSMHGKPYVWGGSSAAGTDCSGYMAMIARALLDIHPYDRREWSTHAAAGGSPPPHFTHGIDGSFAIGVTPGVHTAGTLAGINVEAGGAHNYVAYGGPATGADDPQFPFKFHLPQIGGKFVSGGVGGFNLAAYLEQTFQATRDMIANYRGRWGLNHMGIASAAMISRAVDEITGWALRNITPMGSSGDVESWRPLVIQALSMLGLPHAWADITLRRMAQESGGNAMAVNNWDVNAQRGDPSKGLMQVIGSTFAAYRDSRAPNNVYDPLANILASMRYAMARYGSLPAAYGRAGGYDDGGWIPPGLSTVVNRTGRPEAVLTREQWASIRTLVDRQAGGASITVNSYREDPHAIAHTVERHLAMASRSR